jgi:hypothetical protein
MSRPAVRLAIAALAGLGGAYLVALWAVGVVLMVEAAVYVVFVWDDGKPAKRELSGPEAVLEQYRRAR